MKALIRIVVAAAVATTASIVATGAPAYAAEIAGPHGETIKDQYVVLLHDATPDSGVVATADAVATRAGARRDRVYSKALKGFSIRANAKQVAALSRDTRVRAIYPDAVARMIPVDTGTTAGTAGDGSGGAAPDAASQTAPPWGLDRIDQRALPVNNAYRYNGNASNVRVYVIDSGIRTTHTQFQGRATVGVDLVGDGRNGQDCNGHGTHVAGTIGGSTYGVAKNVKLVAVRVFGCSGGAPWSKIISAIDWVTAHAVKPAVVNMSLGGSGYLPVDLAVNRSIESGVTYSVSAGNEGIDACDVSPARTLSAITVGATGNDASSNPVSDVRSSYSNYGPCLDLFAPGTGIRSSWYSSTTATAVLSGTSMASPHVAGVAALLASAYPTQNPMWIRNTLVGLTTKNVVGSAGSGSPNRLLYTYLRPETTVTLDAAPEPVVRGGRVSLTGTLRKDGAAYPSQTVRLYFTPVGGTASLVTTATTGSTGGYATSAVQNASGTWSAVYPVSGPVLGSSAADAVAVS